MNPDYLIGYSDQDAIDRWNGRQRLTDTEPLQADIYHQGTSGSSTFDESLESIIRTWDPQWSQQTNPIESLSSDTEIPDIAPFNVIEEATAMKGHLKCYLIKRQAVDISPSDFMRECNYSLVQLLQQALTEMKALKLWLSLVVEFEKSTDDSQTLKAYFGSDTVKFLEHSFNKGQVEAMFPKIVSSVEAFQKHGSGWVMKQVVHLRVNIAKYSPLRGSSYVPLPLHLSRKKAIINVKNADNLCFMWSVLSAMHPQTANAHRVSKYRAFRHELNFQGIDFPVSLADVPKFEIQSNISITVYGFENELYPLYMSQNSGHRISLLYYKNHYSYIKSLDRLLSDQNRHNGRKYICPYCLFAFYNEERLNEHVVFCKSGCSSRIDMPNSTNCSLTFVNIHKMLRQPFVIYADFECLTERISSCAPNPQVSSTNKYQIHTPCGFGLVGIYNCCGSAKYGRPEVFRGADTVTEFLKRVVQLADDHQRTMLNPMPLSMTEEERLLHSTEPNCYLCGLSLHNDRVRDHCHLCGRFRGVAHNKCNQLFRLNRDIVVVFHNLRRYDGHLLMQKIGAACNEKGLSLDCIARGLEDYVTFSIRQKNYGHMFRIKFIDSCQFLLSSLDNLVSTLSVDEFGAMSSFFSQEQLKIMLRKGVYPYDYMNNWECFSRKSLPPKDAFYSMLTDDHISSEDYDHACRVWNIFNLEDMGEYHDLYLTTDVLLLADVFENFRKFGLCKYGLDPCHYVTLPSMAWDACLKLTGVKLELLTDPQMYLFFERGIRGGVSMISHRYAHANNPLVSNYDSSRPTTYIIYLDANNLYGWSMVNYLPHSCFSWLNQDEIENLDWRNVSPDSDVGYVLEVDLSYPTHLHETHDSYPLAAEKLQIGESMLSPYCKNLLISLNKKCVEQEKLVPNLLPKQNYIVHYRNLQLYEELGMKVENIHRVLSFHQEPWIRPYIEFNTEIRKAATSPFQKDMLKLFNNAVFGKTCENQRNRKEVKLPTRPQQFRKLVANPRYERSCAFSESLAGVVMSKETIMLNKPIFAGFAVLDLSKLLMYNFHYKYMLQKYNNLRLLFTDTDSLCYYVQTENIYSDMKQDWDKFDTSDYPPNHFLFSEENKKVLGKMKDETASDPIEEFVGLRSKMYSFLCKGVAKKRAKGVKKSVVRKKITHEQYRTVLNRRMEQKNIMKLIRSHNHRIYSLAINKTSLSCYDDKRYLLSDGITSYSYGNANCDQQE